MLGKYASEFFDRVAIRTPALAFLSGGRSDSFFENIQLNLEFIEALQIANSTVYYLLMELNGGRLKDEKKILQLKNTIFNYYQRMYANPTPFGNFAGIGIAQWNSGNSGLRLDKFNPITRLDMEVLQQLFVSLNSLTQIKNAVSFYSNASLFKYSKEFRYIEPHFHNNGLQYRLAKIERSDILDSIISDTQHGLTLRELTTLINQKFPEYEREEILVFVEELIASQVLISSLQINIIGPDPLKHLQDSILECRIDNQLKDHLLTKIRLINDELFKVRNGSVTSSLQNITRILQTISDNLLLKNVVQVDLNLEFEGKVPLQLQNDLLKCVNYISSFTIYEPVARLEVFKNKFIEKFEDQAVPLLLALDVDLGIDFGDFGYTVTDAFSEVIDALEFSDEASFKQFPSNAKTEILQKKYIDALQRDLTFIELNEKEIEADNGKIEMLASTFQIIFSILSKKELLVDLVTAGNANAGCLIGRFGAGNEVISNLLTEIADFDATYYENSIVAEIGFLSEGSTTNISFRPFFREYELPIITISLKDKIKQISLNDLFITIRGGKIILFSKSLKKQIIPKLTNAHNYSKNTIPIYQFLAELQYQDILASVRFDLRSILQIGTFCPRVQYKNIIINKASWKFNNEDLDDAFKQRKKYKYTITEIEKFRAQWRIPCYCKYFNKTASVLLDWSSEISVRKFFEYVNRVDRVSLVEFPFQDQDSFVFDNSGNPYVNECVAFVKNHSKHDESTYDINSLIENPEEVQFVPGQDWLYYKIYCNASASDEIIRNLFPSVIVELKRKELFKSFFFIRYNDPDFHIRFRVKVKNSDVNVIKHVYDIMKPYLLDKTIYNVRIDTYLREIGRYSVKFIEFAEKIFEVDSQFWIEYISMTSPENKYYTPLLITKSIDTILNGFDYNIHDKNRLFTWLNQAYENEFKITRNKKLIKLVNGTEQQYRIEVENLLENNVSSFTFDNERHYQNNLHSLESKIRQSCIAFDFRRETAPTYEKIIVSFVHMHVVRGFADKPREHELFVYHFLSAYYKKQVNVIQMQSCNKSN